jgi:hypothetical protein
MITRTASTVFILFLLVGTASPTYADGQGKNLQENAQEVTLLSRIAHQDKERSYGKSAFNFRYGLRSDSAEWSRVTLGWYDLLYGNFSPDGDLDWFEIQTIGDGCCSKIKDLGALQWSDVKTVPVLPATPPTSTGTRGPLPGKSWEESNEQRLTKAAAGHLYVVHIKNRALDTRRTAKFVNDFYAMFRVDTLEPGDSCTISWKLVPSPEGKSTKR